MLPAIARSAFLCSVLAVPLASGQVSMKLGDLVLFNSFNSAPVTFYSRDNGNEVPLVSTNLDTESGRLLQSNGEIEQFSDGSFYIADLPYSHTIRVDPHFAPSETKSLTVYAPSSSSTFTVIPENLSMASDGSSIRVAYNGTQGAVLKHQLSTGQVSTLSSGGLLTGAIAASGVTESGDVIVAQKGATASLVLVNGSSGAQASLGSNALLSGEVYDLEVLPRKRVAITTGSGGVILATYKLNTTTSQYETTFQNLGNFGGSVQWAKTDVDGNLLFSVYYTPSNSRILKYDFTRSTYETVLTTTRLTSFGVVKYPVAAPEKHLAYSRSGTGLQLDFTGQLQASTNLTDWQALSPQPTSPYTVTPSKAQEFFRVLAADPHAIEGNILFRGNSYTYGQETTGPVTLPNMVKAIASSLPYTFTTDMYAPGGSSFKDHYNDAASLAKVQSNHWHDAVLQNLSTGPTSYGSVADHLQYGRSLYLQQIAQDPNCNVFLYETPAYRADDPLYPATFASPDAFQAQLTTNYRLLARNLNTEFPSNPKVTLVPTGQLVKAAGGLLPQNSRFYVSMHAADRTHMSDNRLALTGLAFFVALTHQNPEGLLSSPGVAALNLNITVDKTWLEKLVWRYMSVGAYPIIITADPQPQSAVEGQAVSFSVTAQGSGPITYQWFKNGSAILGATDSTFATAGTGGASETFYCIATNSEGSVKSTDAILSSAVEPAGLAALVDFSYPLSPGADTTRGAAPNDPVNNWNTWKPTDTGSFAGLPSTLTLVRPDGSASGMTLESLTLGTGPGPNGMKNTTGTPYPYNSIIDYWYGDNSHPAIKFRIKGLKANRTYKLTFMGSRDSANTTVDNRQTSYSVTGTTTSAVVLDAFGNATNTVSVSGMVPDADGYLTVQVAKGSANTNTSGYFYLSVMAVTIE